MTFYNRENLFNLKPIPRPISEFNKRFKIGDTGPAGGIIFYVDYFNEFQDFTFLEVSPYDAANNFVNQNIIGASVLPNTDLIEYTFQNVQTNIATNLAGASVFGMPSEFNFNNKIITMSGDGRLNPKIMKAEVVGSDITYTTLNPHNITVGTRINVTAMSANFNVTGSTVNSVTTDTFTILNTTSASGTDLRGGRVITNRFTIKNTTGVTGHTIHNGFGPSSLALWHEILTDDWVGVADWMNNGLGKGLSNSQLITSGNSGSTIGAANIALNFSFNNYNDWYLPSLGELMLIYNNLRINGSETEFGAQYWSSTENTPSNAWIQTFDAAIVSGVAKNTQLRVRPIRKFN